MRTLGALRCFPGVSRLCTTAERLVVAHEARGGQQCLAALSPQELANTAWAHAKAKRATPALFDAIAVATTPRVDEYKPRQLATTAWAFAKARRAAPPMLDAIAAAVGLTLTLTLTVTLALSLTLNLGATSALT